jgi:hypothetical protein
MTMTNWVIMPFYGAIDLTRQAVFDVLNQSLKPLDLLLIDTHPTRESRELARELRAFSPRVWPWHHDPPLPSLAATWNYALETIWAGGATQAWVVNNDVRLHPQTYEALVKVQAITQAWFLTPVNVRDRWDAVKDSVILPYQGVIGESRGGPDFSCFLIQRECHQWFQFDEQFIPAYHEDNDYHRRLTLAGFGDRIFSVPLPYWHKGSGTLQANEALAKEWGPKFAACQAYYIQKWGGLPHQETFPFPFDYQNGTGFDWRGQPYDPRISLTGQGRPDAVYAGPENWPWQDRSAGGTR